MTPHVLIVCGNGYVFREIFQPVIETMAGRWACTVWAADYYLSAETRETLEQLQQKGMITAFRIISPYRGTGEGAGGYHRRAWAYGREAAGRFSLILMGSDFQIFDRYLLHAVRPQGTRVVVIQTGTLIRVFKEYRRQQGLPVKDIPDAKTARRNLLRTLLGLARRKGLRMWRKVWDHYFYPLCLAGTVFPSSPLDALAFFSGRADGVICYDRLEKAALTALTGCGRRVHLARHPAGWWQERVPVAPDAGQRLLVLFGGNLAEEMPAAHVERWVQVISSAAAQKGIQDIHLRFHPRMRPDLRWPQLIETALTRGGYTAAIVDPRRTSLIDVLGQYAGVIGSPSGALRVARAVNPGMFVVGVPNLSDGDQNDQDWILGQAEGIVWLGAGTHPQPHHFDPPAAAPEPAPGVGDILKTYLH